MAAFSHVCVGTWGRRLTASVRWPARRVVGGALYPQVAVWRGGWRNAVLVPGVGSVLDAAGRPGGGTLGPRRGPLPPPNNAVERTGHSGRLAAHAGRYLWPAAHRERSVPGQLNQNHSYKKEIEWPS
jgi:hypothetical protein